jgi:hypothetical protein
MKERLQLTLLLAGARAAIERTAFYVEVVGEHYAISVCCPPRGGTALRVAPNGDITQYPLPPGRLRSLGNVGALCG